MCVICLHVSRHPSVIAVRLSPPLPATRFSSLWPGHTLRTQLARTRAGVRGEGGADSCEVVGDMVIDSRGIRRNMVLIGGGLEGYRVMDRTGIRCDGLRWWCKVKGG